MGLTTRIKHAWNAFAGRTYEDTPTTPGEAIYYGSRPDRPRYQFNNERTLIASIYTKIAIDAASVSMRHVRLDDAGRYIEDVDSGLNNCLTVEANLDQAATAFRIDMVMSLLDQGCIAIVPVDTTLDPEVTGSFDIKTMRVGKVVAWRPKRVRVSLYNEAKGLREEITLDKKYVAIVENPLFAVMNEPISTLRRLIRKLSLLDQVDEQSSSGKLDLIIQLPYTIKSELRRQQAEQRRTDIEFQLKGSQYGIAYADGTEKITQLNRPVENNLLKQIEYLTNLLYVQLGLTPQVMDGTADEKAMINYYNRTIEPILNAIVEAMRRSFLTKTARSQKQSIDYFRNPFKLVPMDQIAEMADKFSRNEIMSSNEIRSVMGLKPDKNPKSDQLINSNMPQGNTSLSPNAVPADTVPAASSSSPDIAAQQDQVIGDFLDGFSADVGKILQGAGSSGQ